MTDLEVRLDAFFRAFPAGAGAGWLAEHLGVTREQLDAAAAVLGARRVVRVEVPAREDKDGTVAAVFGVEWRACG